METIREGYNELTLSNEQLDMLIDICQVYLYEDHMRGTEEFNNLLKYIKQCKNRYNQGN